MTNRAALYIAALIALAVASSSLAADEAANSPPTPKVPDGFSIELVAGSPLVERPIVAAFDDEGRLYVAESSGSNDPVAKQLAEKPHRIVRLEDTNGDGKFDRRTVFADQMMFPEGAMFLDGSLYVGAPPSIWKLTDKDGDGVADERIEWFKGKTLTGCANDLHGPYAGPDGWIYWCKGAFAEQTYTVNGHEWTTKAAHVFRCRPDGTGFEPVMTSGMDNPVDVAFMPDGERILSGTYFVGNPRRDGLAHVIYGGVYGKENGVLAGHPRTGELMPVFDPMSPAACAGLERYDADAYGADYRDNLFLCQFNLRKVSRHILRPLGSTFVSEDSDFVWSDNVDFHPTDVLTDADGSLLVINTGGWYKLCCPTSQLWKPDVVGGIYRVTRIGAKSPDDPRGRAIAWAQQTPNQLWSFFYDGRPAVRQRASREFVHRRDTPELKQFIARMLRDGNPVNIPDADLRDGAADSPAGEAVAMSHVWALSQIDTPDSRKLIRDYYLRGASERVQHVAMQSISLHRDADAKALLARTLHFSKRPANRRIAAEALGRMGDTIAVANLLDAADKADDRVLQHSIIYALIELADPVVTRKGLIRKDPKTIAAALIALDQMPGGELRATDVIPHLNSADDVLHDAARWVVAQHPEWGGELTQWLRTQLQSLPTTNDQEVSAIEANLESMLVGFSANAATQQLMADVIAAAESTPTARALALRAMAGAKLREPSPALVAAIGKAVAGADSTMLPLAIGAASALPPAAVSNDALKRSLVNVADDATAPLELRVEALGIVASRIPELTETQFSLLQKSLSSEHSVALRSAAADAIATSHLSAAQLGRLCDAIRVAGPLELNRLLTPFEQSDDEQLGLHLIASLRDSAALPSVRIDLVRAALAKYGPAVQQGVTELETLVNVDAGAQRKHIEELLPLVAKGNILRGHAVFYSAKATCSACHRLGYAGGTTGPDLTHVGQTRTERDLLEAILYPSLSFVRSYEPMQIVTQDGKTINGVIRDETAREYMVATGPDQIAHVPRTEVDEMKPSTVSIMPAGLEKQLTAQELADLVAFLKSSTNH